MTFLAPLFILGGLLIAGPIIAHLIRRTTRERVRFSDTRLLAPSPPRLQRRSRVDNWLLLLLRCLVVLALALGFARPFLRQEIPPPSTAGAPQHVVAVLDDSASMRREGLWADAIAQVREVVRDLAPDDRFALVTAGGDVTVLLTGERWAGTPPGDREALVESALDGRSPGWGPTRIDAAVDVALDELAALGDATENLARPRIVLISDCTEGARVAGLAGHEWPADCRVEIIRIEGPQAADVSLQWLGWTTSPEGKRAARVRVHEQSGRPATVTLRLLPGEENNALSAQTLPLSANEARVALIDLPAEVTGALRVQVEGDEEGFNNTLWLVPPQPREFSLPYFGRDHAPNDSRHPLFYLTRAVSGWRDPKVAVNPVGDETAELDDAPLLVVAEPLSDTWAARVRERVEAGAIALVLLADASVIPSAAALVGEDDWTAAPPPASNALLGSIDFQHPLFAPFADPRFSDFTHVRFWRPVPVGLPDNSVATIVARFDDGSPAVLEAEVGRGRVVIWGGDWSNVASQWVLSTKFVPWLQALMERASGGPPRPNVAEVGDTSTLTAGQNVRWLPADPDGEALAGAPASPGVYRLEQDGQTRSVALQVPVAESRNKPLPEDTWEQLGVPVETAPVTTAASSEAKEDALVAASDVVTESEQQFWRWLLLAAAVLLAVESLVAIRQANRPAEPQAAG